MPEVTFVLCKQCQRVKKHGQWVTIHVLPEDAVIRWSDCSDCLCEDYENDHELDELMKDFEARR